MVGDELEVLSPTDSFNKKITVEVLKDMKDQTVTDAKRVQEKLKLYTNVPLREGDILRIKNF
jgi:hypothetical protein